MDNFSEIKSKLMLFIKKPIQSIEEKFEKDLNKLEDLKNMFYELDKTSILKINQFLKLQL